MVGIRIAGVNHIFDIEYSTRPYAAVLEEIRLLLRDVVCIVGFNLKFDLAWLKRYGIDLSHCLIWDTQLCDFIANDQTTPFPSLDGVCSRLGLGNKRDDVADVYWDSGIDTPNVPLETLTAYLETDLELTDKLYLWQCEHFSQSKRTLFRLQCEDLFVLLEMEFNGTKFDTENLVRRGVGVESEIAEIDRSLAQYIDQWPHFNWSSGDHLSCLLYGGTVSVDVAIQYEHTYKGGKKAGTTELRNRWETVTKTFPRLYEPIEGSELQKTGYYSTDESTLQQLKGKSELIPLLLKRAELEKWLTTYLRGIPALAAKMDWQDGFIHGTFNQCRVVTGRLSSQNPNLQNFPENMNEFIITRF